MDGADRERMARAMFARTADAAVGRLQPPAPGLLVHGDFTPDLETMLAMFELQEDRVISIGEWLMPRRLGTKIIPVGVMRAMSWASCPAPLGIERVLRSSSPAASSMIRRRRGSVRL